MEMYLARDNAASLPVQASPGIPFEFTLLRDVSSDELRLEIKSPDPLTEADVALVDYVDCKYYATIPTNLSGAREWILYYQPSGSEPAQMISVGVIDIKDYAADLRKIDEMLTAIEATLKDPEAVSRSTISFPDGRYIQGTPRSTLFRWQAIYQSARSAQLLAMNGKPPFRIVRFS